MCSLQPLGRCVCRLRRGIASCRHQPRGGRAAGGGDWRAVAHVFNVFAIESFIDQMAVDANMDPIAFRYERMGAPARTKACFDTVAKMCDWTAKRPDGRAVGISISERSGSLVRFGAVARS